MAKVELIIPEKQRDSGTVPLRHHMCVCVLVCMCASNAALKSLKKTHTGVCDCMLSCVSAVEMSTQTHSNTA